MGTGGQAGSAMASRKPRYPEHRLRVRRRGLRRQPRRRRRRRLHRRRQCLAAPTPTPFPRGGRRHQAPQLALPWTHHAAPWSPPSQSRAPSTPAALPPRPPWSKLKRPSQPWNLVDSVTTQRTPFASTGSHGDGLDYV
ncbi:hypothetical protein PVAP13_5NG098401 [Panicum virgatum]|uniref:Uncharacterized protein n=1 Tax=Panicum virgatum TaxID=38727 RepID=A0A8T0RMD1_PANVG|nr:hypothetical protein PVAP13_5NG098401 [Panicum virgatum]